MFRFILPCVLAFIFSDCFARQQPALPVADSSYLATLSTAYNKWINDDFKAADSVSKLYYEKASKLQHEHHKGRGAAMLSIAQLKMRNTAEASRWYEIARQHFTSLNDHLWNGYLNKNTGQVYTRRYDFENGIPYLLKAADDFEKSPDVNITVATYCTISNAYHDFGNYEKGKQYARIAINMLDKNPKVNRKYYWYAYNDLGINYDDNKELREAINAHFKAIPFASDSSDSSYSYNNLANTYKKLGNHDSSLHFLQMAMNINKGVDDDYHNATIFGNLLDLERIRKNYSMASFYLDSALAYANKSESPEKLIDANYYAFQLKKEMGDPAAALGFLETYTRLKDSLLTAEKAGIVTMYQEKFESAKKEKTIQQQQYELSKRNTWLILAGAAVLLLLMAFYFIQKGSRQKQLTLLKEEEFKRQEAESKALFSGEQNERIRIARDLHDGVGQMLSLVKMNLSTLDQQDPVVLKTSSIVDKTIDEVRNVSHNLIPEELNFGLYKALENLADKINESGKTTMRLSIPGELRLIKFEKQNELSIYRIVQEVVNNMLKHSQADLLQLSMNKTGHFLSIYIADNGRGMDPQQMHDSNGIGWNNINARVHMMDGAIKVKSEKLVGTQIEIILPEHAAE